MKNLVLAIVLLLATSCASRQSMSTVTITGTVTKISGNNYFAIMLDTGVRICLVPQTDIAVGELVQFWVHDRTDVNQKDYVSHMKK